MHSWNTKAERQGALACAVEAARAAGALMRRNLGSVKRVHSSTQHDIKLELDVRCQRMIERRLRAGFPEVAILGEEGIRGDPAAPARWVVDPIDGTVNFAYGVPHACVSIALQTREHSGKPHRTRLGVVYDPFCDELWAAIAGEPARCNGRRISVSRRRRLEESIINIGFAKRRESIEIMLPVFTRLVHRVRKMRITGSAALALAYVASGRFDAYLETGLRLWDIAAGGLIVECAGGEFEREPLAGEYTYRVLATNGSLHRRLRALA